MSATEVKPGQLWYDEYNGKLVFVVRIADEGSGFDTYECGNKNSYFDAASELWINAQCILMGEAP